jgi:hypothetical protein
MPLVAIKTGFAGADGKEEILKEYLCDWPACPNPAVYTLGCITELRAIARVCEHHTPRSQDRT